MNSAVKYFVTNNPQTTKPFYKFALTQSTGKYKFKKITTSHLVNFNKNKVKDRGDLIKTNPLRTNFIHKFFLFRKKYFNGDSIALVGQTPSLYLNDLKPMKYWKILAAIQSQLMEHKILFFKHNKVRPQVRSLVRRKLRLHLLTAVNQSHTAVKSHQTTKPNLTHKFKPFLKRVATPNYVLKWKTSYPLMFTGNTATNRSKKNKLDLTINNFMRSRLNRRVRRTTRNFFKKVKRGLSKKKRSRVSAIKVWVKKSNSTQWLFKKNLTTRTYLVLGTNRFNIRRKNNTLIRNLKHYNRKTLPRTKFTKVADKHNFHIYNSLRRYRTTLPLLGSLPSAQKTKSGLKLTTLTTRFTFRKPRTNQIPLIAKVLSSYATSPASRQSITYKEGLVPTVQTRTRKNFTFKSTGMFLNTLTYSNQKNPFTYKFLFKKKLFSFLYPNEVRNSLMNRKKRITFYKLVYKLKHRTKNKPRYSLASFNKLLLNQYKVSLTGKTNNTITESLFFKKTPTVTYSNLNYQNYLTSRDEILYPTNFAYRGQDTSFRWSEVKIPRVRFKPGYQRMWRRARTALKESLNLKFIYQKQLTRYLTRFYKGSNNYTFSRAEMSLNRVVMYSRLLPDNPTVNSFLSKKLIYLNGRVAHDTNAILVPNDVVQLIVSMWYYVTYRWIANWTLKRGKKFKKLVYRKGLAGKQKIMKLKKQRSYYTPNWIYLTRYDISDVKPYLEVDYFTLSTIVLYEPFTTFYFSPDETPDFRPTIYRMYNWKYIT